MSGWVFSKSESDLTIKEHEVPLDPDRHSDEWAPGGAYANRRPTIFDPKANTLHVGQPDSFHADLEDHLGMDSEPWNRHQGWIGAHNPDEEEAGGFTDPSGTHGWYREGPERPDLDQAIRERFGTEEAPQWSFSRASTFLGVSTPPGELIRQIQGLGWEVGKITFSKSRRAYEVKAKNEHGEKKTAWGPQEATALANLLGVVSRHELMRSSSIDRASFGLYTGQLKEIGQAYRAAPVYDPKAAPYFMELAQDSTHRAEHIRDQLDVKVMDGPEPYESSEEMSEDIRKGKLKVSRSNAAHPIWSAKQVVDFRIVHDVLGHHAANADFSWSGENLASQAHARMLSSTAQMALFAECIAQSAYTTYHRSFGPQKVALFPEFFDPLGEGKTQRGIHPSQVAIPGMIPGEKHKTKQGQLTKTAKKIASTMRDPNQGWQSGVNPISRADGGPGAGFLDHGDPLEAQKVMETAKLVDTGWHSLKKGDGSFDRDRAKLAIVNAFRVVLLSPRKDLRWNAVHYQDISHIPASVDDPKVYWDTLEGRRRAWNKAQGIDPNAHMSYYKLIRPLQGALLQLHPEIGFEGIVDETQRVLHSWLSEEHQRLESEDAQKAPDKQKGADEIERRANDALTKRIEKFLKDKRDEKTDVDDRSAQQSLFSARTPFKSVSADEFHKHYEPAAARPDFGAHLAPYSLQDLRSDPTLRFYLGHGGSVGAAVRDHGDGTRTIGSLFNNNGPKGAGLNLLDHLSGDPRYEHKLQATGEGLRKKYESRGWTVENASDWDDSRAPEGWDYSKHGRPRVYDLKAPRVKTAHGPTSGEGYKDRLRDLFDDVDPLDAMNRLKGDLVRGELDDDDLPDEHLKELMGLYGHLATKWGPAVNNERVHDAWSWWTLKYRDDPDHKSLVPFDELSEEVQEMDSVYRDAIKKAVTTAIFKSSAAGQQYNMLTGETESKYGAFMGTHLKSIAQISQHSDDILAAALEDVKDHDGTGHHFRQTVLSLGVSGVGPKVCSFAWLLLQPMTSQLATIDTHMMDVLGHNYEKEMGRRDYFKFERELQAGRDASGYGHIPLGAFQWGMWDNKRTGPGTHQDHSAMKVLDPVPHSHIDWHAHAGNLKGEDWLKQAPQWWQNTQEARDKVAKDWDDTVAKSWPQNAIPFQVHSKIAAQSEGELCAAVGLPNHFYWSLAELSHSLKDEVKFTERTGDLDYHITVAYAPKGYFDREMHKLVNTLPGRGKNIPFEDPRLETLPKGKKGYPVVIRFDAPAGADIAEEIMSGFEDLGAEISRFPGGYKPHITLGYSDEDLPEHLKGRSLPEFAFRGKEVYVMVPRGLREAAIEPTEEVRVEDPKKSRMQRALEATGLSSVHEIWANRP